jgi:phospholipid/cholesterol/gamma-HCH transport system permease protein
MEPASARFEVTVDRQGGRVLELSGDWTIWTLADAHDRLRRADLADIASVDVSGIARIDTSGAFLIHRALGAPERDPGSVRVTGEHPGAARVLHEVREVYPERPHVTPHPPGFYLLLERTGRGALHVWHDFLGNLSFIGETMAILVRLILNPTRIRWTSVVAVMEEVGLDALPIVCFLSFFIGLVIAFIGANLLAMFNASVFTVELVGIGMLREFGAVLTAILLAGRTNSAFTAQIGAMKMQQEIDAMKVIGLDPVEALVAPRLIALLVMTPLLTFFAMMSGIAGGLMAAWMAMDISPTLFVQRLQEVVPAQHFWVGIVKAPVFAIVVALVGCRQGLLVEGDVISLGRRTTSSVVQSIFLVITLDALFAVIYYLMDV